MCMVYPAKSSRVSDYREAERVDNLAAVPHPLDR
jgi:hypothetical protein